MEKKEGIWKNICYIYATFVHCKKSTRENGQNLLRDFDVSVSSARPWYNLFSSLCLTNGLKTQNMWLFMSQIFLSFYYFSESCHLSEIWRAFWNISHWHVSGNFCTFQTSQSLGFLCGYAALCGVCAQFFCLMCWFFARFTEYQIYNHWN